MTTSVTIKGPSVAQRPRSRWRWMMPAACLLVLFAVLARGVAAEEAPSTMLGASGSVPGGLARINGVLPYAQVGPQPGEVPPELIGPVAEGSHRVQVLLEITVMEPGGLEFNAEDYAVERLGGRQSQLAWASTGPVSLQQGEILQAELVYELPDQAVELVLEGPGNARLSLGAEHHSGSTSRR
ncbi:hypothetical protein GMA12_16375 [Kocuria sediminis]|uniref:DUF4352 domain-containing protein n=1 Tax=Kocuria sediminis TaxID=1038857 RepID=A0A6N8GPJ8_9MICC|nr:hypothetical protein [Kocuria sediminis]MUN64699.1 hypothetical protein [Kocuria sediminis]